MLSPSTAYAQERLHTHGQEKHTSELLRAQCKSVFRTSARILAPINDMNPMAIADSRVSHVILPMSMTALHDDKSAKQLKLRGAAGEIAAIEAHREIFAEHVTIPLCPLGRVMCKLQLTAIWTPKSLTLSCVNKSGTAHGSMQCPIKGDTTYFTALQFWRLRRALQMQRKGQKPFPPRFRKQLCMTAISEGPDLCMVAKAVDTEHKPRPDMSKCSLPHFSSHVVKALLGQGLLQMTLPNRNASYDSIRIGLKSNGQDKQDWLNLLHLIASHWPAHVQRDCTTILLQVGDVMPSQSFPTMWEATTMIMIGNYKQGEVWIEGQGDVPCPEVCRQDKYKVTDGYLTPANNQCIALNQTSKYSILPAKRGTHCCDLYFDATTCYSHQAFLSNPGMCLPRKRLTKKGQDPFEEDPDVKELRDCAEEALDKTIPAPARPV